MYWFHCGPVVSANTRRPKGVSPVKVEWLKQAITALLRDIERRMGNCS